MSAVYDVKRVIIGVSGGVAEVMERPPDVQVEIRDFDNLEAEEKDPRTTILFWDCNCRKKFIHPKDEETCGRCGARREDQPDAHLDEAMRLSGLSDAMRLRLRAEHELSGSAPEVHPGWMVPPPKYKAGAAFMEIGDSTLHNEFELEGQGDIFLDEEGHVWVLTPWLGTHLPLFKGS
ncbi:MAG: hypothetical protein WBM17_04420 [Anaerolineales bacterium]